ncbi:MAG: NUDIX domain-containing protein [Rhodospirillales bacterium]
MSARHYPISVKGVMTIDGRIPLLLNERQEWELPGGRLESGEQPEQTLVREIAEELGIDIACGPILDSWLYDIACQGQVFIVTYACGLVRPGMPRISDEHRELRLFAPRFVETLPMPAGYLASIRRFLALG